MSETNKKLLIYLPDQFADWEGSYLMSELAQNKVPFVVVSETKDTITSIGTLKVTPEASIDDFSADQVSGLVMIGGDNWPDLSKNQTVTKLAKALSSKKVLVAAICGATFALAREGILDGQPHTSNDLNMLKRFVPSYTDEQNYLNQPVVRDQNLITASGAAPVEFTLELLRALDIYTEENRQHWFNLFKHGTPPPAEFWA